MGNDLSVDIQKEIERQAAAIAASIPRPTGFRISTKGKMFTLPSGDAHPGPMRVIILDYMNYNVLYPNTYDPNTVTPPVCWALGRSIDDLTPSESCPDRQAPGCLKCPKNQFKSASNGRGKACRNMVRLAVTSPVDIGPESEVMILDVAPTGLRGWGNYAKSVVTQFGGPPLVVTTEISFDPNQTYPVLVFGNPKKHDDLEAAYALQRSAQDLLMIEPSTD